MATDAAADRRQHMGELDIELGRLQRAFGHDLGGVRSLQRLAALIDDLFGDCAGLDQVQAAVEVALGKLHLGTRVRKLAVGLRGDCFERAGVDQVKQVAGVNHVAVLEFDVGDEAADPRANLNGIVLSVNAMKLDYQRMLRDVDVKQSQVQSDQANFERFANLVKSGGVTRAEYDNMRFQLAANQQMVTALRTMSEVQLAKLQGNADVDARAMPDYMQAKARVDEAQRQLDHSVIYAPFDGIVTQVDTVQPGMYLAASTAAWARSGRLSN